MNEHDPNAKQHAINELTTPATILLIVAGLWVAMNFVGLFASPLAFLNENVRSDVEQMGDFVGNVMSSLFFIASSGFVAYGALKMRKASSYGLSMAAAIVACVPVITPCCCLGIPFGIWCLVVMNKPEVKAGFDA